MKNKSVFSCFILKNSSETAEMENKYVFRTLILKKQLKTSKNSFKTSKRENN